MNCELCGREIGDDAFGDVDGAIVCPRCLGHVPGVPMDSTVAEFYERNGDEVIYDPEEELLQNSKACCEKESRNLQGGCDNCGDPCY